MLYQLCLHSCEEGILIHLKNLSWRLWWLNFLLCRIKAFFSCFWCPLRKKEVAQEKKSTSKTLIKIKSYQRRILFSPICVLFKVKIMLVCKRVSTFLERVYATIINSSYSWKLWFVIFRWYPFIAQEGKRNEKKPITCFMVTSRYLPEMPPPRSSNWTPSAATSLICQKEL